MSKRSIALFGIDKIMVSKLPLLVSVSALMCQRLSFITLGICLWAACSQAQESDIQLYKFKNEQGVEVRANTIPPHLAKYGYQIVDISGNLIKDVPPAPKAEDLERAEYERQLKVNYESLKRRFRSVDEIEEAKSRKLGELKNNISALESTIKTIHEKIDQLVEKAAGFERKGRAVPQSLLDELSAERTTLSVSNDLLVFRQQELSDVEAKYNQNLQAFILGERLLKEKTSTP